MTKEFKDHILLMSEKLRISRLTRIKERYMMCMILSERIPREIIYGIGSYI